MKTYATLVFACLSLSAPALANDGQMHCHSTGIADGGYLLTITADRTTAELEEQTFSGPRPLASMTCKEVATSNHPDALENSLVCREGSGRNGSLIVRLYEGGFVFQQYAQVSEVSALRGHQIETPLDFGKLQCR